MENNFDLKKFLVENKLTTNSRMVNEVTISIDNFDPKTGAGTPAPVKITNTELVLNGRPGSAERPADKPWVYNDGSTILLVHTDRKGNPEKMDIIFLFRVDENGKVIKDKIFLKGFDEMDDKDRVKRILDSIPDQDMGTLINYAETEWRKLMEPHKEYLASKIQNS